ncbi:hypothetical protein JTB14_027148 [Gonioctena quinquepunctata]|nr:hypothetical protein JTB14_027148 [Gonioctena quinquepunctata]
MMDSMIASYESEVEILLFEEVEIVDEEDPDEIDNVSVQTDFSDTEKEIDDSAPTVTLDPNVPYFLEKDGTKWAKHCSARTSETPQHNIVRVFPGVVRHLVTPLDIFGLSFTDEMLNIILESPITSRLHQFRRDIVKKGIVSKRL